MKIQIIEKELKDVWDIQRAKYVLRMLGLSSEGVEGLSHEDKTELERQVTLYLWGKIKEQFPDIEKFCKSKRGGFNKKDIRNFDTPIINIHGSFYMQLVGHNSERVGWIWETIELEPYRFEFNHENYFKDLVVEGVNKLIISGTNKKEDFESLINALNKQKTQDTFITIDKKTGEAKLNKTEYNIK